MYRSITQTPSYTRVFGACLLSFMTLIAPIASVGAATLRATTPAPANSKAAKPDPAKLESSLFVPAAIPAAAPMPAVGPITAVKSAAFPDADGDAKAELGETIKYSVAITNTGSDAATGVVFSDTVDTNTTFVPSSVTVTPIAFDDGTYNMTGNTPITIAAPGVLTNDIDPNGSTPGTNVGLSAISVDNTGTAGTAVLNTDGSFTFTPTTGFTGTTTFRYTAQDAEGKTSNQQGVVTMTVTGLVWYVDSAAPAAGQDGSFTHPFTATTPLNAGIGDPDDVGQTIFIYYNAVAYTDGISLENNQILIGDGEPFTVNGMAIGNSANDPTIADAAGDGVTLAAGNTVKGLTLGNNLTDIAGAGVGNLTITNVDLTGSGRLVNLTGSGGTVNATFDTATTTSSTTDGVTLSNVNGSVTFGSTPGSASITAPTGIGFNVIGGNATLDFNGAISKTSDGRVIDIQTHTGGTISFDGAVSSTSLSDGIRLLTNGGGTGTTINFTGTLTLDTSASGSPTTAFAATGGGIVTATGTGSTINSGSGIGLNVTNTTIGAAHLTFQKISSNGASSGIVLSSTGASGSLIVAGNGGACTSTGTCTGGAIQNSTGAGISLTNTLHPQFTRVAIQTSVGSGVSGTDVTNFTFQNGFIDNSGTGLAAETSNIAFNNLNANNLDGVVSIINNTLTNAYFHGIDIANYSGTITSADISSNTITSSTSGGPNSLCPAPASQTPTNCSKGSGIRVLATGNAAASPNVNDATVNNNIITNFPIGGGIFMIGSNAAVGSPLLTLGIPNDANNILSITGNRIAGQSSANKMNTNAIQVGINGIARGNWEIKDNGTVANPITNVAGNVISTSVLGNSTGTVLISGNRIVANHAPNFGGPIGISAGVGATFGVTDVATLTIVIDNNNVSGTDGNGIKIRGTEARGTMNARISNNTVGAPVATALREGIFVEAGGSTVGTDNDVCLDMFGNTTAGASDGFDTANGIRLRKQGTSLTVNAFSVEGMSATTSPGVEQYVGNFAGGKNPGSASGTAGAGGNSGVILGSATSGFSSCSAAPLLFASGGITPFSSLLDGLFNFDQLGTLVPKNELNLSSSHHAGIFASTGIEGPLEAPLSRSISNSLSQQQLDAIVSVAIERWLATGLTERQVAALRALKFEISDLQGTYLGEARGNRILVDRDAESKGWFIDPSPLSDATFGTSVSPSRFYTNPMGAPAGHIDLLTAIEHEMGHKLGLADSYTEKDRDSLMYGYLTVGERRLPVQGQAKNAIISNTGSHFLSLDPNISKSDKHVELRRSASQTFSNHAVGRRKASATRAVSNAAPLAPLPTADVSQTIGTLPAGKSVTVTFQATVKGKAPAAALPPGVTSVSNQGNVTYTGGPGGGVLTDDPSVGGATDPTVTPISRLNLSLTKTDGVTTTTPGSDLTYTVSYANLDHAAAGVTLTETVPTGTTFKAAGSDAWTGCADGAAAGSVCTINLGTVARFGQPGASGTKAFIVTVTNPAAAGLASIVNMASISHDATVYEADINPANNTATDTDTLNAVPAFGTFTKDDSVPTTTPGSTLTYTINYANTGNQGATGIVLTDTVPTGTTFVPGSSTAGWVETPSGSGIYKLTVGSLAGGGASGSATFVVTVNSPAASGQISIVNNASITDDGGNSPSPITANASNTDTLDAAPDLTLSKVADVANAGPNETIIYTLTYANAGNQNATGVVITETVPANSKFNAGASTPTVWSCPDNSLNPTTCTTTIGALAGGAGGTVKFAVTVIDPITPGQTQVSNTGSIADDGANGIDPGDNTTGAVVTPLRVCTPPPSGMINWWPGDGNARDIAGGKDGTLNGAAATGTGKVLNGFSFDGDNDYVDVGDVDLPSTFTIDAWVNPTDLAAERTIVNKDNGTSARSYFFSITTTGALRALVNSGGAITEYQTGGAVVTAGILQHVAVTYNGGAAATERFKFYVNGTLLAATAVQDAGGAPENIALATRIGLAADDTSDFLGVIDELEFFNSALSEADIDVIVDAGTGGKCKPSDLTINKSHTGNFNMGSTGNNYTITVHNDGPGTTIGTTTVVDTLPAGLTPTAAAGSPNWTCGISTQTVTCTSTEAIAPGGNFTAITITVSVAANPSTPVNNTATVSNNGGELDTSDNSDTDPTTLVGVSDVSITKTDSPDPVTAGNNLAYTITVSNAGPTNSNTSWTDTLPAGTTFVSLPAVAGWSCTTPAVGTGGMVSCSIPSQGVGASADAVFTLTVNVDPSVVAGTVLSNTATATTTSTDTVNTANNSAAATTTVAASANLSVSKVDTPDPVAAGSNLTYTITVNNAGPSNAASVSLSDTLPAGTTFVSLSSPGGWSCTPPIVGGTGTVSCSNPSLGLGNAVFTLTVNVNASVSDGTVLTNTATVTSTTSDPVTGNESGSATTTVQSSDFAIAKAHTGSFFIQGQTGATYAITVSNVGVAPSSGMVTVTDTLPVSLTPTAPIGLHNGWTCGISLQVLTCTRSDALPNGNSYPAITLTVDVAQDAPASVMNTATVSSGGDTNSSNNSATDTVTVVSPQAAAWTLISSTLQMDEDSLNLASLNDYEFGFSNMNTGVVSARGNLTLTEGISPFCPASSSVVNVSFMDSDGSGTAEQVFFEIRKTNILTGGNTVVYTFNSNAAGAAADTAWHSFTVSPAIDFDFTNNVYWIEVRLTRGTAGASAKLGAVQIYEASGATPCP